MKDDYTSSFFDIVKEASETTGYQLPLEIESYVVMLLADKIDNPNFLPKTTFAQELFEIQNHRLKGKELGDTALFLSGVFPEYCENKVSVSYFVEIGSTSYTMCSKHLHSDLFEALSGNFNFIREFINVTVRKPNPLLHIG